jgi:hypothetical protein
MEESPRAEASACTRLPNGKDEDGLVNKKVEREKKSAEPPFGAKIEPLYDQGISIQRMSLIC